METRGSLRLSPRRWARHEAAPGVVLMVAAALALAAANSRFASDYHAIFHDHWAWSPVAKLGTLHAWINDGLMAAFFFVVGLEIKREVVAGELSTPGARRLPVIAAAAGMAAPALLYLLATSGARGLARGWAIPAATDIAFAVGVLALLGSRVPPALRLFLLTVAIVDDLGAVTIIAVAYTADLAPAWLGAAGAILGIMVALNRVGVKGSALYVGLAVLLWYAVLHSGVHATVAGVLAALTVPYRLDARGDSPLLQLEHLLVPWSAFAIVPLFGFANAGVELTGIGAALGPLPLAIALGLFAGKQLGIFGSIWIACRAGWADRLEGTSWPQLWGLSLLCGIGFTMSLFIAALAFPGDPLLVEEAKLGVLGGSLLSALAGYGVLRLAARSAAAA